MLNDCKYGISMNGNRLELTLLRAAASPHMRTDNHVHQFTYGFTAWEGSFLQSDVVRQGWELNVPAGLAQGSLDMSLLQLDDENIIATALKNAQDGSGDLILRLYESKKAAVSTALHLGIPVKKVYECDMLENICQELPVENGTADLSFRAFEVKTLRIVCG